MIRFFTFFMCFLSFGLANAQEYYYTVYDLDETTLMGEWNCIESSGKFRRLWNSVPTKLILNTDSPSWVCTDKEPLPGFLNEANGYWVGGSMTRKYTLNFLMNWDYERRQTIQSIATFVIRHFTGSEMIIESCDGTARAKFKKNMASALPASPTIEDKSEEDTKTYNLKGEEVKDPKSGIYIRNGEKILIKQ